MLEKTEHNIAGIQRKIPEVPMDGFMLEVTLQVDLERWVGFWWAEKIGRQHP